jgi:alpha-tubulin suppressor-like RCC1 family protein
MKKINAICLLLLACLIYPAHGLWAWKSKAHVYLAMLARQDAIDDGKITLYEMDYEQGLIKRDATGQPKILGSYAIDPWILAAIRQFPEQYKAGAIGPDAFPDLLTGQTGIHPDNQPLGFSISDDWLGTLWNECRKRRSNQVQAAMAGFMTHYAGDLFGHHFVNRYSGGPFELGENALKHLVLESYIDKRLPAPGDDFYSFSIAGVSDFLYEQLVIGTLIPAANAGQIAAHPKGFFNYAPPRIFKSLQQMVTMIRDAIQTERAQLTRQQNERLRQARACVTSDPAASARLSAEAATLKASNEALHVVEAYIKAWLDDIVAGQKAWPQFAADFAGAAIFNPNGVDQERVRSICLDFTNHHLLSMLAFPDMVGESMAVAKAFSDFVDRFIPGWMKELMTLLRTDLETYLLMKAWGVTWEMIKKPEVHFDPVMNNQATANSGERISLRDFNRSVLKINDDGFRTADTADWQRVPALGNSLTMMKLLMLSREGVARLIDDLELKGYTANTPEPLLTVTNEDVPVMLGFMRSLDGSRQWCQGRKMLFTRDGCAYRKLFMSQEYAGQTSCIEPCADPPDNSVTSVPVEHILDTCARVSIVKQDNNVWLWGDVYLGTAMANTAETAPLKVAAGLLPPLAAVHAVTVDTSGGRFAGLARDGSVWLFGLRSHSLYRGYVDGSEGTPLPVPNLASITQIAMGTYFLLALRSNGTVWSCGSDQESQLGQGPGWHGRGLPKRVRVLSGIKAIAAGFAHGLAVDTTGAVYAWGSNSKGQLGLGEGGNGNLARKLAGLSGVKHVAAGSFHSLALKEDGTVWGWGWNEYHQLADGTAQNRTQPVQIRGLAGVKLLTAGHKFSAALAGDGSVWVWGHNEARIRGEHGMPYFMDKPMKVVGIPPMKAIAAGSIHMLGMDLQGRLWIWGGLRMAPVRLPPLS